MMVQRTFILMGDKPYQAQIDDYKKGWLSWRELPKSTQFTYKLLNRVKNHTHELSDDNPVKSLAKKYIWAERLSSIQSFFHSKDFKYICAASVPLFTAWIFVSNPEVSNYLECSTQRVVNNTLEFLRTNLVD